MLADVSIVEGARARLIALGLSEDIIKIDFGEPTQDDRLPMIDLFVVHDEATPRGDPRHGITQLKHTIKLVVQIRVRGNTANDVKAELAVKGEAICNALLSSIEWATCNDEPIIEGFDGVSRVYQLPPKGSHIIGMLQLQIGVLISSSYEETTSNLADFETLGVRMDLDGDGEEDDPALGADVAVLTS